MKDIKDLSEGDLIISSGNVKYLVVRHNKLYTLVHLGMYNHDCSINSSEYTINGLIKHLNVYEPYRIIPYEIIRDILDDKINEMK